MIIRNGKPSGQRNKSVIDRRSLLIAPHVRIEESALLARKSSLGRFALTNASCHDGSIHARYGQPRLDLAIPRRLHSY